MRYKSTKIIACVARDISIPGFGATVNAAQDVLRESGYSLMLATSDDRRDREIELFASLRQQRIDGLILTLSTEKDQELIEAIASIKVPVVLLDRDISSAFDAVNVDHRGGILAATEYLLGLGHKRIALLTGRADVWAARERIIGYRNAHEAVHQPIESNMICEGSFAAEFAFREMTALLESSHPPTAVIAGGMSMLPGTLQAIVSRGLRIPHDISVIASGDTDLAALATPSITAIRWDNTEVGRAAVNLLLGRLSGEIDGTSRRIHLPAEIVMRRSCSAPNVKAS